MSAGVMNAMTSPALVGARPVRAPRSLAARWRARRERLFPGIPDRAFDRPIVVSNTILGRFILVNEPAGVRRVLVDNVANYPKTAMERRFFVALFGAGLLGSDGELWRRHRRIMAPAFDPRSVAAYAPAMAQSASDLLSRWDGLGAAAKVDMADEMVALTLQIICRTMFSADAQEMVGQVSQTLKTGLEAIGDVNILDLLPYFREGRMRRREARMARLFAPMDGAVQRLVARREANPSAFPNDLLGRLVAAKDLDTGAAMTAKEVRDEVVTIFAAGHETTAVTMGWVWYLLSQHPAEEGRLHHELDVVLGGRLPTQDDLGRLAYTRRIVDEAMRLYPAAPGLSTREAVADDEICGHPIRRGANIAIAPWVLHRHRHLWEDPERFDPDRFSPERTPGRQRFAYLPFGAGPRVCIGQVLAMNEAILILASLAQRYRPRLARDARVALRHNVTLQPRYGLKMVLERREGC
ncbi:MAG TPA: cytochrome P450 [Caulobacteraceae bacterium]